jgi:hypothetical protein
MVERDDQELTPTLAINDLWPRLLNRAIPGVKPASAVHDNSVPATIICCSEIYLKPVKTSKKIRKA